MATISLEIVALVQVGRTHDPVFWPVCDHSMVSTGLKNRVGWYVLEGESFSFLCEVEE